MTQIIQKFLPDIPKQPFDNGPGNYIGVCAHSTGSLNDTALSEYNWECQDWKNAFVHFFCDSSTILQVADLLYKAWGAGPKANGKYVHVESCETLDPAKFAATYDNWTYCMAYVLAKKNLPVIDGRTLVSHKWISDNLGGTNHQDPISYLASHGKTWADVVRDVQNHWYALKCPVNSTMTVDAAVEWICNKIHSSQTDLWKKQAKSVQYLDAMVTKIATKWQQDNAAKPDFTVITRVPPVLPTVEESLNFIDMKIHLSDLPGWQIKSKNVPNLDMLFRKICYVWRSETK